MRREEEGMGGRAGGWHARAWANASTAGVEEENMGMQ